MAVETHELRLKINATTAKSGAKEFGGVIKFITAAVQELDREVDGTFTKLKTAPKIDASGFRETTREAQNTAKATDSVEQAAARMAAQMKQTALSSAAALRTSQNEAQRLVQRLNALGDVAGVERLERQLAKLRNDLTAARSPLDVRSARSSFADTSSELKRHANALDQQAKAETKAADAAARHANQLDTLRAKYNPLYASSKAYEIALGEIAEAERAGVLSASLAAQARERAAMQLGAASAATDQYSAAMQRNASVTQQGVMVGHQLSDVLITSQMGFQSVGMIALQQGSQLASQMQMLKASGGGVFRTLLAGFTSLVNPLSLITIGAVAAGAAIAKWFFAAGEETKSFSDALGDANSRISALRSATDAMSSGNLRQLRSEYGALNDELDAHLERLRKIAELEAATANADMIASIRDGLTSDGNIFTGDVDAIRRAFETTNDRARTFLSLMRDVENARTFEEQAAAVTRLRQAVESTTGGLDRAEGGARGVLVQLVRAEDAALRLLAAQNGVTDATHNGASAASSLTYTIGTAADEAARLLMNLNSVPSALAVMGRSVQGQIASIQAQNRALNLQISEGLTSAAASRRVQLQDMIDTASERGQRLNFDHIASQWQEIDALDAAARRQAELRETLSEMNRPARKAARGGGGKSARQTELEDEKKAIDDLNKSLVDRLSSLQAERIELELLATGQVETADAAKLMAEAMVLGGGHIDAQTAAMIRQIDAAASLNEELRRMANDPVKDWMKSVPNWIEAGRKIEAEVFDHLSSAISEFIQTGEMDFEKLGEAILGTVADIVADIAVKELVALLGGNVNGEPGEGGFGLGGFLGKLFGQGNMAESGVIASAPGGESAALQSAVVNGGQQAAQAMHSAIVQAGQQAGQFLTSGGAQAASQMSAGVTTAGQTAGVQMGTQVRTSGVIASTQMGARVSTSGATAATQMGTAIQTAGTQAAGQMGMAVAGSSGGGLLSMFGGGGGLLSMALPLFFAEGGISNRPAPMNLPTPANFRHAPHFAAGTPNTSGIPALLHENEAVIPLSKGRKVPVELGGVDSAGHVSNVVVNQNINTPDADSFRRSQSQIQSDAFLAGRRAAAGNG